VTYDQRRLYATSLGLIALALGVVFLVRGATGSGAVVVGCGALITAGGLSGRGLRQRPDDTSDPRNHL
jgi:uncharacterized membrane protein